MLSPQFPTWGQGLWAFRKGWPSRTRAPVDTVGAALPPLQGFELGTLAGPAFAWLRHSLGLAEEDYQAALGPGSPYLQFLSTSKSKACFFLW